jgi:hypothetical protein
MTDPFRLRVKKAITDALKEITPANGYNFDFSQAVFRGRLVFGQGDPLPMLSILEPPLPLDRLPAPTNAGHSGGDWDLLIQGFVKDDKDNPTDPAELAMADVKKRLAVEQSRQLTLPRRGHNPFGLNSEKGNRVESIKIGAGVVRPPEEGVSTKAYFWLTLTLKITEDNSQPFG